MSRKPFSAVLLMLLCALGASAATRDEAIDLVLNQVISPSPYAGKLVGYAFEKVTPAGESVGVFESEDLVTLAADTWVFWLDYEPAAWFVHPCALVLVDDADLTIQIYDVEWYPVVGGQTYYGSFQERISSPDQFYGDPNPQPLAPEPFVPDAGISFKLMGGTHAVIATGPANHPASNADQAAMEGALTSGPPAPGVPAGNVSKPKGSKQALCDALDALPEDLDKLYFHFTGHGNAGGVYFGDPAAGPRMSWADLKQKLKDTGAKEFCITIEACKSGGGTGTLDDLPGSGVTSTDRRTNACFRRSGSNFTQAFAGCLKSGDADSNKDGKVSYGEAKTWAKAQSAKVRGQNPQGWGVPGHSDTSLVFPWVSHSNTYLSTVVLQNPTDQPADVGMIAHRGDGTFAQANALVPAHGLLEQSVLELFPGLEQGAGFCLLVESGTEGLSGRCLTRSVRDPAQPPTQARAVDMSPRTACNPTVGRGVMFSYVPDADLQTSVFVMINVSPVPTQATVTATGSEGDLVGAVDVFLPAMAPLTLPAEEVVPPGAGSVYVTVDAETSPISGAVFMFDAQGRTSVGNAEPQP